ncbi:MAG: (d)CMP kinase [Bacteroidales bacterium]|nr:(d)CMP kinase [Bacteroidales bacterium]
MKSKNKDLIIAIDGYSACGKSTFAKAIAKELRYTYIDSGAMYRAVTLYCLNNEIIQANLVDLKELKSKLPNINIEFKFNHKLNRYDTYLNNENVEEEIRSVNVSDNVSPVSKIKEVRAKFVEIQRNLSTNKRVVMDGRDIGSVVFPNADIKIFLTASVAVRARRRYDEMISKGLDVSFQDVEKNITERDYIDENRDISPLTKALDAIILDNSNMNVDEQMEWFKEIYNKVQGE